MDVAFEYLIAAQSCLRSFIYLSVVISSKNSIITLFYIQSNFTSMISCSRQFNFYFFCIYLFNHFIKQSSSDLWINQLTQLGLLSAIWHENLVPLIGYCCEKDQQILVYPFMSNGSLQDRLYGIMFHENFIYFSLVIPLFIILIFFVLQVRHPKGKFLIGLPDYLFVLVI